MWDRVRDAEEEEWPDLDVDDFEQNFPSAFNSVFKLPEHLQLEILARAHRGHRIPAYPGVGNPGRQFCAL